MYKEEMDQCIQDILKDISWSTAFKSVDLNATVKGNRCVVACDFYTDYNKERAVKLINLANSSEGIEKELTDWVKYLENGILAIQRLNEIEKKFEESNEYYTNIVYRWGDSEDYCTISDWTYTKLEVQLSEESIHRLISFEPTLEDILNTEVKHEYDDIISYIKNIQSREINKAMGVKLKTNNVVEELMRNKLSFKDVKSVINPAMKGEQIINSAVTIRDLDLIGLYIITINYNNRAINIELSEDKLLDIENERFIRDETLTHGLINTMSSKLKQIINWI